MNNTCRGLLRDTETPLGTLLLREECRERSSVGLIGPLQSLLPLIEDKVRSVLDPYEIREVDKVVPIYPDTRFLGFYWLYQSLQVSQALKEHSRLDTSGVRQGRAVGRYIDTKTWAAAVSDQSPFLPQRLKDITKG